MPVNPVQDGQQALHPSEIAGRFHDLIPGELAVGSGRG